MSTTSDAARSVGPVVLKSHTTSPWAWSPRCSRIPSQKAGQTSAHGFSGEPRTKSSRRTAKVALPSWGTRRGRSRSALLATCRAKPWAMVSQTASGVSTSGK
jgi:hypothetical protein